MEDEWFATEVHSDVLVFFIVGSVLCAEINRYINRRIGQDSKILLQIQLEKIVNFFQNKLLISNSSNKSGILRLNITTYVE